MLKSLQMKLVLILMLLVIAVMAVVGTFLINSVTAYNIAEFQNQVANFFQHHSEELEQRAEGDQPVESMEEMLKSYTRALGLSNSRNFYIVDGETGQFVGSSEEREDAGGAQEPFTDLTPNMITAMGGEVGQQINALSPYFDVAMPLDGGRYVFAVVDNKTELNDLTWNIFTILLRSLMFGLAVAIMFSFILARTITVPVQNLTKMATRIAKGDFSQRPQTDSSDEIGTLTRTFGEMAQVLETTLSEVNGERNKLNTLFLHMADGMVAFDKNGHILHMNPAAQRMLGLTFDPQMTYTQVFPNLNIDDSDLGEDGKYIEIDYAANKRILKIFLAMFGTQDDDYSGVMAVLPVQLLPVPLQLCQHRGALMGRLRTDFALGDTGAAADTGQVELRPRLFFWRSFLPDHGIPHGGLLLGWCTLAILRKVSDALKNEIGSLQLCDRHGHIYHLAATIRIPDDRKQDLLFDCPLLECLILIRRHGEHSDIPCLPEHFSHVDLPGQGLVVLCQSQRDGQ